MSLTRMVVDFETYYSDDYSLRRMTYIEYITDPRFEALGAAIQYPGKPAFWIDGDKLAAYFGSIDWSTVEMVSHNISFDGSIMGWRFGHYPARYLDTLGMSRAMIYHATGSAALGSVAEHLGLAEKQSASLAAVKGWRLENLRADRSRFDPLIAYAKRDAETCLQILERLAPEFPAEEYEVLDMVARMAIEPRFMLDQKILTTHLAEVRRRKAELMSKVGVDIASLQSSSYFAGLLREYGIEPPQKVSKTTGQLTYAFAKTDRAFTALLDHEDENVQALVAARLGVRSTLEETRTERFIKIANADWGHGPGRTPYLPIPLRYSGAHTHRLSGDGAINLQNLPRKSPLRQALRTMPGWVIVSADASQIEARITAWLAGCEKMVTGFANKEDIYSTFASVVFGRPVNKKEHPTERFVGKTCILGLGYGMGAARFKDTLWTQGKLEIPGEEAQRIVQTYRRFYSEIPTLWGQADLALQQLMRPGGMSSLGPVTVLPGKLLLPNGMRIHYNELRYEQGVGYLYRYGRETKNLFGGKLVENIVQALARIAVMDAARAMRELHPSYPLALQVHDSLAYVVPEDEADQVLTDLISCMRVPPSWAHGLPLDAEGGHGSTLATAEPK